jgi:flagellar motility protein MotE (MotC chaperone)
MTTRNEFTQEEAVLLAKALAKCQAEIASLEEQLEDLGATKDQYRNYWLEECEKTKGLEQENQMLKRIVEAHESAKDLPSAE